MQEAGVIDPNEYLSDQQVAKQLKVTTRTLQRWRWMRKSPPFTKVGQQVYYRRQAFKDWLLAREDTSRSNLRPRIEINPRQRNAGQRNARRATK